MRYVIDKTKRRAAYLQLYAQLRADITDGSYACGMRMPSKRTLAEETGASVITVEHAYALLADEGYIEARERSGYFVVYRREEQFFVQAAPESVGRERSARETARGQREDAAEPARGREASDAGGTGAGAFSFSTYARTIRRVLSMHGERVLNPVPNTGLPELKEALVSYLARSRGIHVAPEQIIIGAGAEYLYGLAVQMIGREHIYGLEDPSYEKIRQVYEANGATCEMLAMGRDGIRDEALAATSATVLHVTPFHSFPTGITATASKRHAYLQWAARRSALILEDDYDSEFSELTKAEDTLFLLEPERSVLYLNTFSCTIASSMRMGYMVLPRARAEAFLARVSFYACAVPALEQYALAELLDGGDFERHINRERRRRRQRARAERRELTGAEPPKRG